MRDIAKIIRRMHARSNSIRVEIVRLSHPRVSNQLVWRFNQPPDTLVIQIESPDGMCPFIIESSQANMRQVGTSIPKVIDILCQLLQL